MFFFSFVTASKMIILCRGLQTATTQHIAMGTVASEKIVEMVNALSASMERKFHRMEYNSVFAESAILDPRFKKLAFNDNKAVDEAVQKLTSEVARCGFNNEALLPSGRQEMEEDVDEPQTPSIWRLFDERASGDTSKRNPTADAIMEIRSYLEEPHIHRTADPLSWWESKASIYPRLTSIMRRKLCIVATFVPSERIFSKTGQIVTERRNRISSSKLRHLVFLNANLK